MNIAFFPLYFLNTMFKKIKPDFFHMIQDNQFVQDTISNKIPAKSIYSEFYYY